MKIYTKGGDQGETSLIGGKKVSKEDDRLWAYGTIDELNSFLGLARSKVKDHKLKEVLLNIQKELFNVGAELASLGTNKYKIYINEDNVSYIENTIDTLYKDLPKIKRFVIPGGSEESGVLDVARTTVRKAERYIVKLKEYYDVNEYLLKYINRLSDLLYTMARIIDYKEIIKKSKERIDIAINLKELDWKKADYIIKECIKKAEEISIPMVIYVCDQSGNPISMVRMSESLLVSLDIARDKAYTAAALKMSTDKLKDLSQPTGELYGINSLNKIITFGGGIPISVEGRIIGAIGVSGGTVKEDIAVAEYGVKAFQEVVSYGTE
ncbi:cob(I)yrinic acid a,c-diamide adenosyltransferase [uncultured Clostridium sp.]|uniref:cob(I)yrinic acid a,c-diamide adenosyltransferase n=1 Tax=uncultured Clostridium sp. TaxID=59620 RepID=UPI0028E519F2|nr:cob(I)yrinic acid a,c-diamide adenosyltransferase [uncultured Clostridium sp.]